MKVLFLVGAATVALSTMAGCANATGDHDAPEAADATLAEAASITNGSWTANAYAPFTTCGSGGFGGGPNSCAWSDLSGRASFSAPAGSTRKAGVCMLQLTGAGCNTVADCATSPATLPPGGARYCVNVDNAGYKQCGFRPGSATSYCAGSPALSGNPAVAPGTYTTPRRTVPNYTEFVSYACFEGCGASDPSVSSSSTNVVPGEDICWDANGQLTPCGW